MGLYICHAIGAFPYTATRLGWKEILSAAHSLPEGGELWAPLTKAFQSLRFKFLDSIDHKFACSMREDGRLASLRSFLRRIWREVGGEPSVEKAESLARDFSDELASEFHKAEAEWSKIDASVLKWGGAAIAGAVATGGFSLEIPALGFCVAAVVELLHTHMTRRSFRKRVPMSVFIDLKGKTTP